MRRGMTSTLCFNANIDLSAYQKVVLTIEDTYPVTEKQVMVDITADAVDGQKATFTLTQEDSLKLRAGYVKLQLRASANSGAQAVTSNILKTVLKDSLKEEEV